MANFQLMPLQPTLSTSDECFIAKESLTDAGEQDTLRDTIKKHWNMTIAALNHSKWSRQEPAKLNCESNCEKFGVANRSCPGVY